jgi:hypothetical protein
MDYVWKKRLVRMERILSAPLRQSRSGDLCGSVTRAAESFLEGARRRALPVAIGALATCCILDFTVSFTEFDDAVATSTSVSASPAPTEAPAAASVVAPPVVSATRTAGLPPVKETQGPRGSSKGSPALADVSRKQRTEEPDNKVSVMGPPAPRPSLRPSRVLTEKEVAAVLRKAGFGARDVARLTCTARFESGFNPLARNRNGNGTQDSGLFQVNDLWLKPCGVSRGDLFDPVVNAQCAKIVHEEQGTRAWMAFNERRRICERYRVGDFARKGQKTIRAIVEAHEKPQKPKRSTRDVVRREAEVRTVPRAKVL